MSNILVPLSLSFGGLVGTVIGGIVGANNYYDNRETGKSSFERTAYLTSEVLGTAAVGAVVGATFPISAPAIMLYKYQQKQKSP